MQTNGTKPKAPTAPTAIADLTLLEMQAALKRPLPQQMLKSKTLKGKRIDFVPWYTVVSVLDKYCPGWQWQIVTMHTTEDRIFLVGRLTVPTADGPILREATGTEELKRITDEGEIAEIAYGDPSSNAESMAFRRCAAKFGLCLYMYK